MLKKFSIDEQYNSKFITIGAKIINFFLLFLFSFFSLLSHISLSLQYAFLSFPVSLTLTINLSHSHHVADLTTSLCCHLAMLSIFLSLAVVFFFFFLSWVSMVRFKGEWVLMGVGGFPQVGLVASGFRWVSGTILGWVAPVLDGFWVGFCGGWLVIACGRVLLLLWFFFFLIIKGINF